MELTRVERWILSNQYHILEKIDPANAKSHRQAQDALGCGYEMEYDELCQHIYEEKDTMSEAECRYVLDVMTMFEFIQLAYDSLPDKTGIKDSFIDFPGFDGNTETTYLGFARHFCRDGERYGYLRKSGDSFNSHMPTRDIYSRMLNAYRASVNPHQLTKDDLVRIQQAISQ